MKKSFVVNREKEEPKDINLNFELPRGVKSKVLDYQVEHIKHLVYVLLKNRVCLDASDTGTGKTYCALGATKAIGCRPFIICPKPVITSWTNVCKHFAIEPLAIINYDTLRNGAVHSEYIQKNEGKKEESYESNVKVISIAKKGKVTTRSKLHYSWTLPSDGILIFDEAHKCKNTDTLNSMLLQASVGIPNKVLMLSATIVDKPDNFAVFGYLLGLSSSLSNMRRFIASYTSEAALSAKLHSLIFPLHGGRLKISALGSSFPKNFIITDTLYVDKDIAKEIDNNYKEIKKCLEELKNKEIKDKGNILSKMLRSRQKIEMLKLPMLVSLINDNLENNLSVVVFLNFNESIKILADHFKINSLIWGSQSLNERDKVIENFQNNISNLIIANVGSGSTGISLHDLKGKQRTSLISPGWSSIQLSQCLGRIYRSGSKSPAIQRLLYTSGTIEETIASKIKAKLKNLSLINDGDLI